MLSQEQIQGTGSCATMVLKAFIQSLAALFFETHGVKLCLKTTHFLSPFICNHPFLKFESSEHGRRQKHQRFFCKVPTVTCKTSTMVINCTQQPCSKQHVFSHVLKVFHNSAVFLDPSLQSANGSGFVSLVEHFHHQTILGVDPKHSMWLHVFAKI